MLHIPEARKRYPLRAEHPRIGHYREYPRQHSVRTNMRRTQNPPYLTIITPAIRAQTRKNRTTFQDVPLLSDTEMPTTGDLKPGDSLFGTTPPIVTDPLPSPPDELTNPPNYDIGIYEVLREVHAIKILFHHCNNEITFVRDIQRCPRDRIMNKNKFEFCYKTWLKSQTGAYKSSSVDFIREIG